MHINKYLEKTNRTRLAFCDPDHKAVRKHLQSLLKSAQTTDLGDVQDYIIERIGDLICLTVDNPLGRLTTHQLIDFNDDLLDQMSLIYHANGGPVFNATIAVARYVDMPRR